jgi:hypothetical protein
MPANWLDNLPDNVRSTLDSHDVHNLLEMEHVSELTPSSNRDHTINEDSIPELPISLDVTSDQQLEVLFCHTSFLRLKKTELTQAKLTLYLHIIPLLVCSVKCNTPDLGISEPILHCCFYLQAEYSVDSGRTQKESTSDGVVQSIDFLNHDDHYDQLESYCSAFVQSLQSQAREMVDKVMQVGQ